VSWLVGRVNLKRNLVHGLSKPYGMSVVAYKKLRVLTQYYYYTKFNHLRWDHTVLGQGQKNRKTFGGKTGKRGMIDVATG